MNRLAILLIAMILSMQAGCGSSREQSSTEIRVLFVGNSITYYHGVPYLFEEIAGHCGKDVSVDFLVEPGGELADVLRHEGIVATLARTDYDIVILQEWGSRLLCGASDSGRRSPECAASLDAHRVLGDAAGGRDVMTVLFGTHQPTESVASALIAGEKWVAETLGFDRHIKLAQIFLNGRQRYPEMGWTADDGIHPGPDLALSAALTIADAAFGAPCEAIEDFVVFETVESPARTLTYAKIESDLSLFRSANPSRVSAEKLALIRQLMK